jgi:hypothetical protein
MRLALVIGAIALLGIAALILGSRNVETFRDSNVMAGEVRRAANILSPHIAKGHYIVVGGKGTRESVAKSHFT